MHKIAFGLLALALTLQSCSEDDMACSYETSEETVACIPYPENKAMAGFTVTTAYQAVENGTAWVGAINDTRFNSQAPLGDDWATTTSTTQVVKQRPANWKSSEIGQVFGIAIDGDENVYLASSDVYAYDNMGIASNSGQQSQIYRCVAPGFVAVPFITFTAGGDPGNDIGNIAYDKVNDQIFATHLENGFISRITGLNTAAGTEVESYDPWSADTSGTGTIVSQAEQVWGVGVNYEGSNVKVYFPRITPTERSIYSTTLVNGSFDNTPAVLEVSNIPGNQFKITDISFSSDGNQMLIAERGNPHQAKVMSYSRSGTTWSFNLEYEVGGFTGENSAGGVDFAYREQEDNLNAGCDDIFWASGNYLGSGVLGAGRRIYGIEGISYSGNIQEDFTDPTSNVFTDILIDNDDDTSFFEKYAQGDVETFDADNCFDLCAFSN